jgi:hypothetical protein
MEIKKILMKNWKLYIQNMEPVINFLQNQYADYKYSKRYLINGTSMALLRYPFEPEVMHDRRLGTSSTSKPGLHLTVFVRQKRQINQKVTSLF